MEGLITPAFAANPTKCLISIRHDSLADGLQRLVQRDKRRSFVRGQLHNHHPKVLLSACESHSASYQAIGNFFL